MTNSSPMAAVWLAWLVVSGVGFPAPLHAETTTINPSINPAVEDRAAAGRDWTDDPALKRIRFDFTDGSPEEVARRVLAEMTLGEKIGQLCQISVYGDSLSDETAADIRNGRVGSLFYTGSAKQTAEAQRIAREDSRLGVPLLTPRDVIHGFRTVAPIPLAQAASWNPELVEQAARISACEALEQGVNWTFSPMLDVTRDARWGRIAECVGEDPVLASAMSAAMVRGYQQPHVDSDGETTYAGIAACAKHFAAYGLTEGGRDYNRVEVSLSELHSAVLPPFKAAVDAGCATFMTGFSAINGIPPSGHRALLRDVLKGRWGFDGLVVSDWASVVEMIAHGYAADRPDAARLALTAGLDMEMATTTFSEHLASLHEAGTVTDEQIDDAVLRVLVTKLQFALPGKERPGVDAAEAREATQRLTRQSCVLLKNDGVLPFSAASTKRVAVIGPLADAARDQLGCWMLDGKADEAVTPLAALRDSLGDAVGFAAGLENDIDVATDQFDAARALAAEADVAVLFVGEGWALSGEARCRADLDLPGAQKELVRAVAETGTPTVMVVLAGRPLTIGEEAELVDAILYAWHPGTLGGPAIADLLTGEASPSGKLPVTFPKRVGQLPLYYNHPNTGRPALPDTEALIGSGRADFPELQKYRSHYLDVDPFPAYPFGFGLAYTTFEYGEPELSTRVAHAGQTIGVRTSLTNTGDVEAEEVAQLYVQDVTGSLARPVRELKAFRRVRLAPGETTVLEFALPVDRLGYFDNAGQYQVEPGAFRLGVGGDSRVELVAEFVVQDSSVARGGRTPSNVPR